MDMDDVAYKLCDEHSRTTTLCSLGIAICMMSIHAVSLGTDQCGSCRGDGSSASNTSCSWLEEAVLSGNGTGMMFV
jgi:hypothetical protein